MKKIFGRNQVIITSLAILIAIAGYLNFISKDVEDSNILAVDNTNETSDTNLSIKNSTNNNAENETVQTGNEVSTDDASKETSQNEENNNENETVETDNNPQNPGETVLVSADGTISPVVEAKIKREQARSSEKELILEMIENVNLSEADKEELMQSVIKITNNIELEMLAENTLTAKGFTNPIVTINNEKVEVIVNENEINENSLAQIQDVIISQLNTSVDKITITPCIY